MSQQEELEKRKEKRLKQQKRRRRSLIFRSLLFATLLVVLVLCILAVTGHLKIGSGSGTPDSSAAAEPASSGESSFAGDSSESGSPETGSAEEPVQVTGPKRDILEEAELLAQMYDYDAAIDLLKASAYAEDADVVELCGEYAKVRNTCVAVDVKNVPHVFFHSFINDSRGLILSADCPESRVRANNSAMVTVGEFDQIIQQMYEAGYVMVRLDDLVIKHEDGTLSANTNLMLPPDKKPFVMSEDDLSYYHAYGENGSQGYADRLVIDGDVQVKCQYTDPDGNVLIGDYDVVPRLNTFIHAHPDFVYHNARPTIALTGFNGIFGYRTNDYYKEGPDGEDLSEIQKQFLRNHPEYSYEEDCEKAREVAQALLKEGWDFASHTYLHLSADTASLERIQYDTARWNTCVGDLIGGTDKIIFAFGADIGTAGGYNSENEKYVWYHDQGYRIFCNCDGTLGWTQLTSEYLRTGRFALDGFTLYQAITPDGNSHTRCSANYETLGVRNIESFFDKNRTTPINSE